MLRLEREHRVPPGRFLVIPVRYVRVMELIMSTAKSDTAKSQMTDIEELLSAAGIDFRVVERCPHPECIICVDRLSVAA